MTTATPVAQEFKTPASGRRYRKHNTRIINQLRKKFPNKTYMFVSGDYAEYDKNDLSGVTLRTLTPNEALQLLAQA